MKKVILIALALMLTVSAFAAEIMPMEGLVLTGNIESGKFAVGFTAKDFSEDNCLYVKIYDTQVYSKDDIDALAVGDTIYYNEKNVTVESINTEDGVEINGGFEHGGITLRTEDGNYIAINYEMPAYVQAGALEMAFADEVTFSTWKENENGSVSDEKNVVVVPAAEIKDKLCAYADEYTPDATVMEVADGKIAAITVNYTP